MATVAVSNTTRSGGQAGGDAAARRAAPYGHGGQHMGTALEPPRSTMHTIVGPQSASDVQPGSQMIPRRLTQTFPAPRCSQVVPLTTKQVPLPPQSVVFPQASHSRSAVHGGGIVVEEVEDVGAAVVLVVAVVVVVGQQSCGHVEQSSAGPHSPSPHTQLQGGDPPVQLQRPARQSAMTCLRHALLDLPLRPLAAISSLQAV